MNYFAERKSPETLASIRVHSRPFAVELDWFYLQNGRQIGPVPVAQFEDLVHSGRIPPETLVWRDGLVNWQPFNSIRVAPSPQPALPGALAGCAECGLPLPLSDMIPFGRSWICAKCKPLFLQRVREGAAPAVSGAQAWQSGDEVVILNDGTLPERCIKCNGTAFGQPIKSNYFWHPNQMAFLLLIPPIYIIAFFMMSARVKLSLPVCEAHRWRRRLFLGLSLLFVGIGFGTIIVAQFFGSETVGFLALLSTFVVTIPVMCKATLASVKTVDGQYVWLRGFCKEYRASLPEFPDLR